MELDTHTDTMVLGRHCLVVQDFNRPVDVPGWDSTLETIKCLTVTGMVAYDHPTTGKTYMLVFNQAIYAEAVENHLICPMQCQVHGVTINNTPKMFVAEATEHSHAIIVDMGSDSPLVIPLALTGVASTFAIRTPSLAEYNNENNTHVVMTSESLPWDPHDPDWASQEAAMTDLRGQIQDQGGDVTRGQMLINSMSCSYQSVDFTNDNNFSGSLERSVNVCFVKTKKS
jgi:hypothetical protein